MRRVVSLFMLLIFAMALLFGCGLSPAQEAASGGQQQTLTGGDAGGEGAQIAFLATPYQRSMGYGQAVWNTINRFAGEEGSSAGAYTIDPDDMDASLATLELAVKGDARVVVAIGEEMGGVVQRAQQLYPDIRFVLLDAGEDVQLRSGGTVLLHDALQGGWLAGYAAVLSGARSLGYVETENQPGKSYGYGFVLGAEAAAAKLRLAAGQVTVEPLALEEYDTSAARRVALQEGFEDGLDIVFACDGVYYNDIARAASSASGRLIALELESSAYAGVVAGSLQKAPADALYELLLAWQQGAFPTARVLYSGLATGAYTLEVSGMSLQAQQYYAEVGELFSDEETLEQLQNACLRDGELVPLAELPLYFVGLVLPPPQEESPVFRRPAVQESEPQAQGDGGESEADATQEEQQLDDDTSSGTPDNSGEASVQT